MNQNTLKKALSYVAAIVAAFVAAVASGALMVPPVVVQWAAFAGVVLGIFGASPIGRVVGKKERREVGPTFPAPDADDVITADERPKKP